MPPPEKFWIFDLRSFLVYSWGEITDNLLLNLVVVFETRRINGVTPLRAAEAAKQLVVRVRRGKRSHTDIISPSLAAGGATHE